MTSASPSSDTGHELAMGLRAAYACLRRRTGTALIPHAVSSDQFVLLTVLAKHGAATQQELVGRCHSDTNTLGAMLALLESKGLIERSAHTEDGRAWMVSLSPAGRTLQKKAWRHSESVRVELGGLFSPDEARTLITLLDRITAAMKPHMKRRPAVSRPLNGSSNSKPTVLKRK